MHYYGAVYRPPSEAYSLIVQCTLGCSHNKCAFCNMYKDKKFSIRPVEEVLRDLAEARSYERRIERIFLADGDALILPMDYLLQVLDFIREYFPECTRVAAYATTKAIERKTDEELRKLREHGLALVYIGLESGNEELLLKFNKGVTAAETVKNALRCKAAGIAISVTAINGIDVTTMEQLNRVKNQFTAGQILRLMEGSLAPVACLEAGSSPCDRAGECRTLSLWAGLNDVINKYLDQYTLADLLREDGDYDYVI